MGTRSIVLAVAVGIGVAGCQMPPKWGSDVPPPTASQQSCSGPSCDLKVTVDANCVVSVEPEVLNVKEGRGTQTLNWKLGSSGFKFSEDPLRWAIYFKEPPSVSGQFRDPKLGATQLTLQFTHNKPGTVHTYGINVVRTSNGEACSTKDPWVFE